jgi:hypothetical protein
MVRVCLLLIGLSQGCSFAWHDAHIHHPVTSKSECPGYVAPVLDVVGGGILTFLATAAYVHRNDADSAAEIWVEPLALTAAAYTASAIYGVIEPGRCEREQRQLALEADRRRLEATQRREEDRAELHRVHAREQAWIWMQAAAQAARGGSCAVVQTASTEVRGLDVEFHDTVFVRDVAIARCLAR